MVYLYYKPSCPFCQRVLTANESIGAPLALRDISANEVFRMELITLGGKQQVPFLVDEKRGVRMYESVDIIEYLTTHYAKGAVAQDFGTPPVCQVE